MADFDHFKHGGSSFPLPLAATTGNTALRDADPALFFMLEFYAYVLTTYIGARLVEEAAAAGAPITAAVVQSFPFPPERYGLSEHEKLPALYVYRTQGVFSKKTLVKEHDTGRFGVAWVLPPLTAGQAERLEPLLNAAKDALVFLTEQGWDPGYTPTGGAAGDQPWTLALAGLEEIGIETWRIGAYPDLRGNIAFPALTLDGRLLERRNETDASLRTKFTGADVHIDATDAQQSTVADVVQIATQQAPTIASLSVATGSIAGGTNTTITGTLFLSAPRVFFGGVAATNVVFVSATSITCTTPAHEPSACDVVVTNRDGQSGTLASGFTFTSP